MATEKISISTEQKRILEDYPGDTMREKINYLLNSKESTLQLQNAPSEEKIMEFIEECNSNKEISEEDFIKIQKMLNATAEEIVSNLRGNI